MFKPFGGDLAPIVRFPTETRRIASGANTSVGRAKTSGEW